MVTLGDIVTFLKLDRSGFDRGLDQAESRARSFSSNVSGFLSNAFSFATGQIVTGALVKIAAGLDSIKEAMIGGNQAFEQYQTQFGVLLGNADLAAQRMQELAEFGQRTPFELPELVQADRILQSFGLHAPDVVERFRQMGIDLRTITGDIASGAGASYQEIATLIGRFSAGATGEAIQRFQELGITTRAEMAAMGVEFSKSGELVSPLPEALDIVLQIVQQKFGGMMEAQSRTFGGMMSNLSDWIGNTGRILGEPIFDKLKEGLQGFLDLVQPGSPVNQAVEAFADTIRLSLDLIGTLFQALTGGGLGATIESWATNLVSTLENVNAFLRQLKDEILGLTAGDIMGELGPGLDNLNQQMNKSLDDLSKRHEQTVSGLQQQLTNAGEKLTSDLAAIEEKYADQIADLNERRAETAESFQERLTDLTEQHNKKRANLEEQIDKAIADREEKLTELKADHARRRRQLTTNLMLAESEEQYLAIQEQLRAEDEQYAEERDKAKKSASEQVDDLKAQLTEENAEYDKQQARLQKQRDKALADIDKQLNRVLEAKNEETVKAQEEYAKQVKLLNDKIAAENAAYTQQQQEIKDMYAQQMADFQAEVEARAAAIGQGPAAEIGNIIRDAIGAWNDFKTSAAAAWAEVQKIVDIFQEQGLGAGLSALAQLATQKLNEISLAINTWVSNPATQEQFRTWGYNAGQALVDGIVAVLTFDSSSQNVVVALLTSINNAHNAVYNAASNLGFQFSLGFIIAVTSPENIEQLKNAIGNALAQASQWWGETLNTWGAEIMTWWGETINDWAATITDFDWGSVGQSIVDGLWGGLQEKWGELTAWLQEQAAQLPTFAQNPLGTHSPSTAFADKVGRWIPPGIRQGFEEGLPDLRQAISQGMQSLLPAQPAASLAGVGGTTQYVTLAPNFNLGQAPAGFDAEGLLRRIDQRMINLLAELYKE